MKKIACVLLGAGSSKRMGSPKLLFSVPITSSEPPEKKTVFEITLLNHMESSVAPICAVVPGWLEGFRRIVDHYADDRISFVEMDSPCDMSQSLRAGWAWLEDNVGPDAIMISLADMFLVRAATADGLAAAFRASDRPICVPVYRGTWGHPVIVSAKLGDEIMHIEGDRGARDILTRHSSEIEEYVVDTDEVVLDMDTDQDMENLIARMTSR